MKLNLRTYTYFLKNTKLSVIVFMRILHFSTYIYILLEHYNYLHVFLDFSQKMILVFGTTILKMMKH